MNVALCLKFQPDPRCNLTVIKTENTAFFSFDTKFICYHPFLGVANKRETEYENKSTALDRQRETNCHRTIEADTDIDIIFLVCCCSSLGTQLASLGSPGPVCWCRLALTESSLKNGCHNFQPIFTSL